MIKTLKVRLNDNYDSTQNTRFYDKGEILKVEPNEFGDFYHIWIKNKLDLIPKNICTVI